MSVPAIPPGYHTLTPYFMVKDAERFIEFLQHAFEAKPKEVMRRPEGGGVWHAEIQIGDSMLMLGEANEKWPPMPLSNHLYVPDVDAVYRQALAAGATSVMEPADQFYGDRSGGVRDTWGNLWWLATRVAEVSPEEMKRRAEEYARAQAG